MCEDGGSGLRAISRTPWRPFGSVRGGRASVTAVCVTAFALEGKCINIQRRRGSITRGVTLAIVERWRGLGVHGLFLERESESVCV